MAAFFLQGGYIYKKILHFIKNINVQKTQLQYKSACSTYGCRSVYLLALVALRGRVKTGLLDFIEKVDVSYGKGMFFLY